ncbi:11437_t:CDS:2 [Funneliformis geosporum]|uniref:15086_t:CDS:1 n=1 Tax=Funneliformis geosporum TaxID=1117311 RepID=A0A9W4SD53_9GLOM|nr:15086_t:CDS:2 [Funneliformis geosporum]CAI2171323.1 11437_t:CDS:2 [Funneliformis geosporum]
MGISYNTMWFTIDNIDTSFEEVTFESSDESSQNFTAATFLTIENLLVQEFLLFIWKSKVISLGVAQKTILICWPCRRSFQRNLANRYVSSAGIPFGEKNQTNASRFINRRKISNNRGTVKEYYLDTYFIDQLKLVKRKFRKKRRDYEELEQLPPLEDDLNVNEQDYENSLMERVKTSLVDNSNDKERTRTSSYNYHRNGSSSSPSMIQIIEPPPVNERDNDISDDTIRKSKYSRRSRNSSLGIDNVNNPAANGSISKSSRRRTNSLPLLNFDE